MNLHQTSHPVLTNVYHLRAFHRLEHLRPLVDLPLSVKMDTHKAPHRVLPHLLEDFKIETAVAVAVVVTKGVIIKVDTKVVIIKVATERVAVANVEVISGM